MAQSHLHMHYMAPGWRARLDYFLASQGQGFNAGLESRTRLHELAALEACTDAELAEIGLTRADISAHVFADLLGDEAGSG